MIVVCPIPFTYVPLINSAVWLLSTTLLNVQDDEILKERVSVEEPEPLLDVSAEIWREDKITTEKITDGILTKRILRKKC